MSSVALEKPANHHLERSLSTGSMQVEDVEPIIHWRTWLVVAAAGFTYLGQVALLAAAGFWKANVVATVGGATVALWLPQSFQVVNAVLGPPMARFGDQCGRKWLMVVTGIFGVVGSIIIATSKTMGTAIAGATIFGVYWAVLGNAAAIASEVVPRRHRGTVQLMFQGFGTVGAALGTTGGSAFIIHQHGSYPGWRGIFLFTAALMAVGVVGIALGYNPPPTPNPQNKSFMSRALNFDIIGSTLFGFGLVPIMMALIWGGSSASFLWSSKPIIATLTVGFFFLAALAVHQIFITKTGLFAHALFKNRNFAICLLGLFTEGMVYITFNNYFGTEEAVLFDPRPLQFSLRFNAFTLGQLVSYPVYGYLTYKWRLAKECMIFGFICFLASIGALCGTQVGWSKVTIGLAFIAGFGFGAPIALIQTVIQLAVDPEYIGLSTALCLMARSVGGSVGTAIAGAVFTSKIDKNLPAYIAAAVLKAGLPESSLGAVVGALATGATVPASTLGVTPAILAAGGEAYLQAFAHSLRYVWYVQMPFLALTLGAVICLKSVKKSMNALIDRPIEAVHHKHHIEAGHIDSANTEKA